MICSVEDCSKPVKSRGWCEMHYYRWRRHGDVAVLIKPDKCFGCKVDGCTKVHFGQGYCQNHYMRWHRYGDPLAGKYFRTGPDNTVELPCYGGMHHRLRKLKTGRCSTPSCERTNTEMALIHGRGTHTQEGHRCVYTYSTDTADYIELCAQCHRRYDENPLAVRTTD